MRIWPLRRKSAGSTTDITEVFAAMLGDGAETSPSTIIRNAPIENTTVAGGIRLVATAAWSIPWHVQVPAPKDQMEDAPPDHPVRRLLEAPNPWLPWEAIVEHVISERVLHGRAFLLLTNNNTREEARRGSPPLEIIPLPYDLVQPVASRERVGVKEYRVTVGQQQFTVHPDHMVDVWGWSPKGLMRETSDLRSAARSIDAQNLSRRWNNSLLRRSARPNNPWSTDLDITSEQADELEKRIAKKYGGANNAGKPIVTYGGLKPVDNAWNPADMEWIQGIREARREVAVGMSLPPELLGDPEVKTYANAEQARLALYEDRAWPILKSFAHVLRTRLRVWYRDVDFFLDLDAVPAVQKRRTELAKSKAELVRGTILTPNEAREELGYKPLPGGDDLLVAMSMVPIGSGGAGDDEDPAEGEGADEDEGEQGTGTDEETEETEDPVEANVLDRRVLKQALKARNGGASSVLAR